MKKHYPKLLASLLFIAASITVNAQRITVTVAGNGIAATGPDGKPGRETAVNGAELISVDASGNVFYAESSIVRMVSARTGTVSTIAGGGLSTAEGILATDASISPQSICTDALGNLYLVTGTRIRVVDAVTHVITTYAGTGAMSYSGDGGPASAASFSSIGGICMDAMGNMYVTDKGANRIRKITFGGGLISTIAGTGLAGYTGDGGSALIATLSSPSYITCDPIGNIYFSDQSLLYIRSINALSGIINTYAGGGSYLTGCLASSALLGPLSGLCINTSYNVCWDEISCSCREINHYTDSVNYIGGNFTTESFRDDTNSLYAWMNNQYGLTSDDHDNIYIADHGNNRIRKLIKVTNAPKFALGSGQSIDPCPGYPIAINKQMAVTDLDMGQTETWTVVVPPANGALAGFPATASSNGVNKLTEPPGVNYYAPSTFTGADSFVVAVTDGITSDTVTVYVSVQMAAPATVTGLHSVCQVSYTPLTVSVPGGVFTSSNSDVVIDPATFLVTGVSPGVDTIFYNMEMPCPLITSFVMTVNPMPAYGAISGPDSVCVGSTAALSETVAGGVWSSLSPSVGTVDASGVFTAVGYGSAIIEYSVSNAWCTSDTFQHFSVREAVGPISGTTIVCVGSSIHLSDAEAGGTWTLANGNAGFTPFSSTIITVSGIAAGTDTMYYTNTNACGTGTQSFPFTVSDPPSAGTITGPSAVCVGMSSTYMPSITGGTWTMSNTNATVGVITGSVTGYVTGTDSLYYHVYISGCYGSTGINIAVQTLDAGSITGPGSVCAGATISLGESATGGVWSSANSSASISLSGVVSGLVAGMDTLIYSVTAACGTVSASYPVTVITTPDPGSISGPSAVCAGSDIAVGATVPGGVWTVSNAHATISLSGTVSGINAGIDSVFYIVTNVCGSSEAAYPVTVMTVPDPGAISGPATVCKGATITLSESATGGIWTVSNTDAVITSSGVVTGLMPGTVYVNYAINNMCGMGSANYMISVGDCNDVGIVNIASGGAPQVFPNPTQGELKIVHITEATTYHLVNLSGECVMQGLLQPGDNTLSLVQVPPSVYMLELKGATAQEIVKIVKD